MIIYIDDHDRCEKGVIQLVLSSYMRVSLNSNVTKKFLNNILKQQNMLKPNVEILDRYIK